MHEEVLSASVLNELSSSDVKQDYSGIDAKIIVLDDDPTGVQTVNNVSVYTDWSEESIRKGFSENSRMFFILTNSRSFTAEYTKIVHEQIAERVCKISKECAKDFLLISRGDSTLRGHYPLETLTLKDTIEKNSDKRICGEIICPFFAEGGRFTINNIHYVKDNGKLYPAGQTEFAKDKTFGYSNSHLGKWAEEKTGGAYKAEDMIYISLKMLKDGDVAGVVNKLMQADNFNKIIVNACCYKDISVFAEGLAIAMRQGKNFMIRCAAAIPKVLGKIADIPYLLREDMVEKNSENGGIIIVGSHVKKTTDQLNMMMRSIPEIDYIEFDASLVKVHGGLETEAKRIAELASADIKMGVTAAVFTSRKLIDLGTDDKEAALMASVKISDALTSVVSRLDAQPAFIVAKGGITSSDVGTKALAVKKTRVLGQPAPGIPVWQTGSESRFPGLPYVIFPGNVGDVTTLRDVVATLIGKEI